MDDIERHLRAIWRAMRQRCEDPRSKKYPRYGGRGIYLCAEWQDINVFVAWARSRYRDGLQIDRRNNDGPYSPNNCRFITGKMNMRNTSINRMLTAEGETKCLADWLLDPRCTVWKQTLYKRLANGWDEEAAVLTPSLKTREKGVSVVLYSAFGETKGLFDWAADPRCGTDYATLKSRIDKHWDMERALLQPKRRSPRKGTG